MLAMCAVKDRKTGLFSEKPFTVKHTAEAIREWGVVTKNPDNKYGKHPDDYELHHIGNYNDETGMLEPFETTVHLANGV